MSFADRFSAAHTRYNKASLAKASVETVVNFHKLLYMEIQYLIGCDVTWKNATAGGASDETIEAPNQLMSFLSAPPKPAASAAASAAPSSSSAAAAAPAAPAKSTRQHQQVALCVTCVDMRKHA